MALPIIIYAIFSREGVVIMSKFLCTVEFVRITAAMRQRIAFGACGALLFLCLLGWMLTTPDSMLPIHFHATGEELRRCTPAVPVPNRELSLANQVVPLPDFDLMPFKHFLKSREQLEKVEWLTTLYNYLLTLNKSVSPHLNMVNGDYNHRLGFMMEFAVQPNLQ